MLSIRISVGIKSLIGVVLLFLCIDNFENWCLDTALVCIFQDYSREGGMEIRQGDWKGSSCGESFLCGWSPASTTTH